MRVRADFWEAVWPWTCAARKWGRAAGVARVTFATETAAVHGARFDTGVSSTFRIIGAVERMDDVLTGRHALRFGSITEPAAVDVHGAIPATCYGGGARFTSPGPAAAPFPQAELGAPRLDSKLVRLDGGDDSADEFPDELANVSVRPRTLRSSRPRAFATTSASARCSTRRSNSWTP